MIYVASFGATLFQCTFIMYVTNRRVAFFCIILNLIGPVSSVSSRKIYTLFTQQKTWNEARDLCADQFGQLLKLETDRQMNELMSLDTFTWGGILETNLLAGELMWIGVHRPNAPPNNTAFHQDCEQYVETGNSLSVHQDGRCGSIYHNRSSIHFIECNAVGIFVCERLQDDCWFEPFIEYKGLRPGHSLQSTSVTIPKDDVNSCALACRNYLATNTECWGLYYDESARECNIYSVTVSDVNMHSSYLMNSTYLLTETGMDRVFYIRRCFEGLLDEDVYMEFVNIAANATSSDCSTKNYTGDPTEADICFCSVDTQPPIPPPISSEDRAAELVAELTIESSNTSSALRKLISAEDNRPSAVSVGAVGVALLSIVFGGLMLMDLNVAIIGIKNIVSALMSKPVTPTTTSVEPPTDTGPTDD